MKKIVLLIVVLTMLFYPLHASQVIPIGQNEGAGRLLIPTQIEEGPDGDIYIYDQMDTQIKVFSPDGRYVRKIGRKGQGPGEIQRSDGVSFGFTPEGQLFFTEFFAGHPWMTFMNLDGNQDHILKFEVTEFFGVAQAAALKDGRYLVEFDFSGKPEKKKDFFLMHSPGEIALVDSQGRIQSIIQKTDPVTRISYYNDGADSPIPFSPGFYWAPYKDETILFADGLSKNIQMFDYSGKSIREITTSLPKPDKVTGKDLEKWREDRKEMMQSRNSDWYNRFGKVIEKYKKSIHKFKPNISGLDVTPGGNILAAGALWKEEKARSYWLLDSKGQILAKIRTSVRGLKISPHFVFFGTVDEDGIIKIYALKRQGDEGTDLARIETVRY